MEIGYRSRLHRLRSRLGLPFLEAEADDFIREARERSQGSGLSPSRALAELYAAARLRLRGEALRPPSQVQSPRFWCDPSLGGLARWLRAAGYEASVWSHLKGEALLRVARATEGIVLTSDGRVAERLQNDGIDVVWVPTSLGRVEQLHEVMEELDLVPLDPRCMSCGGALRRADKDSVRERIHPRTALWLDAYFLCTGCGKLLWPGTHWERIRGRLADA